MSEEVVRLVELGVAGIALTIATHALGIFRIELLGVVFSLTTLAGQSLIAFLEQHGAAAPEPDTVDPPV